MESSSPAKSMPTPSTQGIKYAGSKRKLIPHILKLIEPLDVVSILDGFSGTTRVSQAFAKRGYRVTANDLSIWSRTFATCYLKNFHPADAYTDLFEHLNGLAPVEGWFTTHYGGLAQNGNAIQADGLKRPWQIHNTQKLDAIREEIDRLKLDEVTQAVALTGLILALDKVDNTVGHYVSYLKDWSPRSFNDLLLRVPEVFDNEQNHQVVWGDVFSAVLDKQFDLAYFDPPYGSNNEKMPPSRVRYASYYHLWKTVCLNDQPELVGKSRRRADCSDRIQSSVFEEFRRNPLTGKFLAIEAIEALLQQTKARWILFSYNNSGRATAMELQEVFDSVGKVAAVSEIDYQKNVMASMRWTDAWVHDQSIGNRELLFLIEKA